MKIFRTSQITELDRYTIENEPIESIDLMERASKKFTETFSKEVSNFRRIFVFAGPGNNGGDALAIARLLAAENYQIETYLFNNKAKLSVDCNRNQIRILSMININFYEIQEDLPSITIEKEDIIIDGLFGSGLNKSVGGLAGEIIRLMNQSEAKIYSIDIPSGLFGENNEENTFENIVKAYKTFTFQAPKLAFLLSDNASYVGDWKILDIGLHTEGINRMKTPFYYLEKRDIVSLLRVRNRFDYKNNFGHALIVAGSKGKIGAAILAAKACLRIGAGLVSAHIPECGEIAMQIASPETMTQTDTENDCISEIPNVESFLAIGIGSGIGQSEKTFKALEKLLTTSEKPLVLDADALNLISNHKELMQKIPANSILTPHIGELERLVGKSSSAYERLEKARNLASDLQVIVVLKGAYTAICLPNRDVYFNSTGNPGMATAGSGDVLTGIITGLLAQSYSPENAAKIGVFIHGLAGDLAAEKIVQESLIAGDIIEYLSDAFLQIRSNVLLTNRTDFL
jgi:NAD(P)H-hydrate epimerase